MTDIASISIKPGTVFLSASAAGEYLSKVVRRHRDAGYWETVILSGGHPALVNSIQIVSGDAIRHALLS